MVHGIIFQSHIGLLVPAQCVCVLNPEGSLPKERSKVGEECQYEMRPVSLTLKSVLTSSLTFADHVFDLTHLSSTEKPIQLSSESIHTKIYTWFKTQSWQTMLPARERNQNITTMLRGVKCTSLINISNTGRFNGVPVKQYSLSSSDFFPTSHLPCYPLPIPLRAPLSSPGRDTKGPVRQSNQELPWMAGAYISPSIPRYLSRQKFI